MSDNPNKQDLSEDKFTGIEPEQSRITVADIKPLPPDEPDELDEPIREANFPEDPQRSIVHEQNDGGVTG
jgi:hypothetical protein